MDYLGINTHTPNLLESPKAIFNHQHRQSQDSDSSFVLFLFCFPISISMQEEILHIFASDTLVIQNTSMLWATTEETIPNNK